jgi:DNA-binding transcriptional regulator GbsR (MarR family)
VSNSLKELVAWKLIRRVPIAGDRREHFEAETEVWEIAMRIAQGRKEREIDPAAVALKDCVERAEADPNFNPVIMARLHEMRDFVDTTNHWYNQMLTVPKGQLNALMKMGDKVLSLLKFAKKKPK